MNIFSIEVKLYSGRDSLVYHEPIKFEYDGRSRDVYKYLEKALDEIEKYRALGTVEELRIAKEKQKPKKPVMKPYFEDMEEEYLCCPTCGEILTDRIPFENKNFYFHCLKCGQKFDWSDSN